MNRDSLMEKLIDIERAIDSVSPVTLRYMVIDAQECFLLMRRECASCVRPDPGVTHLFPSSHFGQRGAARSTRGVGQILNSAPL